MSDCGSTRTLSSGGGDSEDFHQVSSTEVVIIDGHAKFRDVKRWKNRYCTLTKLSPVADCLQLQIYRDEKERARNGHTKASLSLQDFLAMESGFTLDKESHTLCIICMELSIVLAFENRERLIQWSIRISNNLGETHPFLLQLSNVPPKSKLSPGPVKLHITDKRFCLTSSVPPKLLAVWEIQQLRRYGIVDGKLVFEGGSRCGKGAGVHVLIADPAQANLIIDTLDMSSKGQLTRLPSRRFPNASDSPRKSVVSKFSEMRSMSMMPNSQLSFDSGEDSPFLQSSNFYEARSSQNSSPLRTPAQLVQNSISPQLVYNMQNAHNLQGVGMQNFNMSCEQPLPSAMERCLSCTSKLGQISDLLKPSWTMDLGSNGQNVPNECDKISLSSHGSSGGDFYGTNYDTPRNMLMKGENFMKLNRAATPPHFCNLQGTHIHNYAHESPTRYPSPHFCTHQNNGMGSINMNPIGIAGAHHHPYENYDFPRGGANGGNMGGCSGCCCANNSCAMDWSKKLAMDRHSVASSEAEWYDAPKSHCGTKSSSSSTCSCSRKPLSPNPMENYDFPSLELRPVGKLDPNFRNNTPGLINGEGKMPLVTSSVPLKIPIYAQIDKSKKKINCEKNIPDEKVSSSNYVNLDFVNSLSLYENSSQVSSTGKADTDSECKNSNFSPHVNIVYKKEEGKEGPIYENEKGVDETSLKIESSENRNKNDEIVENIKNIEEEAQALPLRRSSSVPCKGGHANRGSASSSDSGVSGDGALYYEESSPLNELGSHCLHESLRRKGQKISPLSSKSPSASTTPKEDDENSTNNKRESHNYSEIPEIPLLSTSPRHYETIDETLIVQNPVLNSQTDGNSAPAQVISKLSRNVRSVSDGNSTSSGASDMSDYIDTLSSSSRGSLDLLNSSGRSSFVSKVVNNSQNSPSRTTVMKPRSGGEYSKIDRSLFTQN